MANSAAKRSAYNKKVMSAGHYSFVGKDYANIVIEKCRGADLRKMGIHSDTPPLTSADIQWIEEHARTKDVINYHLSVGYKIVTGKSLREINPGLLTFGLSNRYEWVEWKKEWLLAIKQT